MYTEGWNDVKSLLQKIIKLWYSMTYDVDVPMDAEVRQNGAIDRFDVMYSQAVHNGQTVYVDIEPLF